jgi:hypothetical protein
MRKSVRLYHYAPVASSLDGGERSASWRSLFGYTSSVTHKLGCCVGPISCLDAVGKRNISVPSGNEYQFPSRAARRLFIGVNELFRVLSFLILESQKLNFCYICHHHMHVTCSISLILPDLVTAIITVKRTTYEATFLRPLKFLPVVSISMSTGVYSAEVKCSACLYSVEV